MCQTGLIGIPFPMAPVESGIPVLVEARAWASADAARRAATAIMTTDTVRKEVVVEGAGFTVGGMAKGAAMLAPNMATMLAVLTTDAALRHRHAGRGAAQRGRDQLQPDERRRLHVDQRHGARVGERGEPDVGRPSTRSPMRSAGPVVTWPA